MGICNATGRAWAGSGGDSSTAGPPAAAALLPVMPPDGERLFLQALGLEEQFTAPAKQALKAAEETAAARARARLTRSGEIDRRKLGSKRQARSGHLDSAFKKARRCHDPAKSRWWGTSTAWRRLTSKGGTAGNSGRGSECPGNSMKSWWQRSEATHYMLSLC